MCLYLLRQLGPPLVDPLWCLSPLPAKATPLPLPLLLHLLLRQALLHQVTGAALIIASQSTQAMYVHSLDQHTSFNRFTSTRIRTNMLPSQNDKISSTCNVADGQLMSQRHSHRRTSMTDLMHCQDQSLEHRILACRQSCRTHLQCVFTDPYQCCNWALHCGRKLSGCRPNQQHHSSSR